MSSSGCASSNATNVCFTLSSHLCHLNPAYTLHNRMEESDVPCFRSSPTCDICLDDGRYKLLLIRVSVNDAVFSIIKIRLHTTCYVSITEWLCVYYGIVRELLHITSACPNLIKISPSHFTPLFHPVWGQVLMTFVTDFRTNRPDRGQCHMNP